MKLKSISIRNFRRLEDVNIDFEDEETIFVGPNNSGKTSATASLRRFVDPTKFQIHDFSVTTLSVLEGLDETTSIDVIPTIQLDLWFSIDPDHISFGRAFTLLNSVSENLEEVGIRLSFNLKNKAKLLGDYNKSFPEREDGKTRKTILHYLGQSGNLKKHFGIEYKSLEKSTSSTKAHALNPDEGAKVFRGLIKFDFVDAQRNIDDEEAARSNKLSSAFAGFYKKNLDQADVNQEANRVIDENNESLTKHYDTHFSSLLNTIEGLGVPAINDRHLKIISSLSPEVALKGNTDLVYVDSDISYDLPEANNGLGFKNLVYMAIQVKHFHLQWMRTAVDRPLCQLILIEEPEAHLHAQVQQTFITNIFSIVKNSAEESEEEDSNFIPQIAVTTHSSHILDAVDFKKIRYFKKCYFNGDDPKTVKALNASKVLNLATFDPEIIDIDGEKFEASDILKFLKQYLKLTHCDLFFADAAILVEGTVEKLLLPMMIDKTAIGLKNRYITILEIGGAYAHKLAGLMEFLGIPYVVITDIDSINPIGRKSCPAAEDAAITSNNCLKYYLEKTLIKDLIDADNIPIKNKKKMDCFVTFQKPIDTEVQGSACSMHGRTLEEMFIYENLSLYLESKLTLAKDLPTESEEIKKFVFNLVKSKSFKKTEFALNLVMTDENWNVPEYITRGLVWLEERMNLKKKNGHE